MNAQREMTLAEWVAQLPPIHSARKEFDQLRQRVAEAEQVILSYNSDYIDMKHRADEQAEAKLALAEQLLREASPMIDDYSNILYSEYSDYEKSGAAGALSGRIAAAIDASGETK